MSKGKRESVEQYAVFTYGTLLSERVLEAVIGRVPKSINGTLRGYIRRPIQNQCYPVVLKTNGTDVVDGKLLMDISGIELQRLDNFEDAAYDRALETVYTDDGMQVKARVWVRPVENKQYIVLDKVWNLEGFKREDEDWYVQECMEWASKHGSRL